jgi:hypothetical protein
MGELSDDISADPVEQVEIELDGALLKAEAHPGSLPAPDLNWWRGYRGSVFIAPKESVPLHPIGIGTADEPRVADFVYRTLPLLLDTSSPTSMQDAIEGAKFKLDVLIDACGPDKVLIRGCRHIEVPPGDGDDDPEVDGFRVRMRVMILATPFVAPTP